MKKRDKVVIFLNCGPKNRLAIQNRKVAIGCIEDVLVKEGFGDVEVNEDTLYSRLMREPEVKEQLRDTFQSMEIDRPNDPETEPGYAYLNTGMLQRIIEEYLRKLTGCAAVDAYLACMDKENLDGRLNEAIVSHKSEPTHIQSVDFADPTFLHVIQMRNGDEYTFLDTHSYERKLFPGSQSAPDTKTGLICDEDHLYWGESGNPVRQLKDAEVLALLFTAIYLGNTNNIALPRQS